VSRVEDVGDVRDFAEKSCRVVRVGGRDIAVIRWNGELFAFKNVCAHQGAPLCGDLATRLDSDRPGNVRSVRSAPVVQCTRHRWEFDVRTGEALYDPKIRVRTYKIREAGDRVLLEL
jgi:nitrite reductase/ring-hydroxylating ferredoxin subunit